MRPAISTRREKVGIDKGPTRVYCIDQELYRYSTEVFGVATTTRKPNVTLQTIADRLGVSRTTVSNAFSRPDQLAPELRDRVLATARDLDYCGPDPVAKSLRSGKSGAYGMVLTESLSYLMSDPAALLILQGIAEVFDEREAGLLALPARLDRSSAVGPILSAGVDGFIAYSLSEDDPRMAALMARNLPVVVVHAPETPGAAFIAIEDEAGAYAAAGHLLDLGHRRISVLSFPLAEDNATGLVSAERLRLSTMAPTRDRIRGYQRALADRNLNAAQLVIWECPINSLEAGTLGAGQLLDRADRPTALLVTSDQLALGALEAARNRGLRVPADLAIVGFDDIPAAARSDPPLTTVRQPLRPVGAMGARMLLDGWEGEPPRQTLPTQLVVRASSAPARSLEQRNEE